MKFITVIFGYSRAALHVALSPIQKFTIITITVGQFNCIIIPASQTYIGVHIQKPRCSVPVGVIEGGIDSLGSGYNNPTVLSRVFCTVLLGSPLA